MSSENNRGSNSKNMIILEDREYAYEHYPFEQLQQIVSLEDSELLTRRSKSSSHSRSRKDNVKRRYLLKKKETTENEQVEKDNSIINRLLPQTEVFSNLDVINTINTLNTLTLSKSDPRSQHEIIQTEETQRSDSLQNVHSLKSIKELKEKYKKTKANFEVAQKKEEHWRRLYFTLMEDSLLYEETIMNLIEENRIHQEYIISLENKLNKVLTSCNDLAENFHSSLNLAMSGNVNSSYNEMTFNMRNNLVNDYKQQLEILAEEKESLSTNLSMSRHQLLQMTMKMEAMQTRLYNMERCQLEEWKSSNISK